MYGYGGMMAKKKRVPGKRVIVDLSYAQVEQALGKHLLTTYLKPGSRRVEIYLKTGSVLHIHPLKNLQWNFFLYGTEEQNTASIQAIKNGERLIREQAP
ncbi:MAG: hypothetical protein KW802_04240 [Candidatus Doudnabacteria bacterium]|nr:hypothetical protein [Candidatus Doudnabacteria bacterium]